MHRAFEGGNAGTDPLCLKPFTVIDLEGHALGIIDVVVGYARVYTQSHTQIALRPKECLQSFKN